MVTIAAVSCVFGLGMCFALLGSIGVKLMPRLGIDRGRFGTLISVLMTTSLIASLIMGMITDKIGFEPVAVFGFLATSLSLFVLGRSRTFASAAATCVLLGLGAMALNTAGNTLIPIVLFGGANPAAASNLGNVFFGLGLFLTPMAVSFLFRKISYANSLAFLGVLILLPIVPALMAAYPKAASGFDFSTALSLLANPLVIVGAVTLFLYSSVETSFCNWLPSYAKEIIGRGPAGGDECAVDARAQRTLSWFAIAMMAGRLVTSQAGNITRYGGWVIGAVMAAAAVVILVMTKTRSAVYVPVTAALAGFLLAPAFPTTVGLVFSKHPANFGSIFGLIFAGAMLGGSVVPKLVGNLARGATIQKSLRLLIPICLALALIALLLGRLT
jgi:fucose permease